MWLPDLARTTAFRWTLGIAAWFVALSLLLFAFVYWQTALYERAHLDAALRHQSGLMSATPSATATRIETWLTEDQHNARYAALFAADGHRIVGNVRAPPPGLPADGIARAAGVTAIDEDSDWHHETIRALMRRLGDGRLLVVGHDTDQLEYLRDVILRGLGLGVAPMIVLSLAAGALLGYRARLRIAAIDGAIGRVMAGHLGERLPLHGRGDEFDRLAASVNTMLGEIERLVSEIRGVGDSIAHDLRTPLTRTRARLERSRGVVRTQEQFQSAMDHAIAQIDHTLTIITAVLRIGEIEHARRRAAFEQVELSGLVREVAELYDPIAEEKGVRLALDLGAAPPTFGDRDLIFEAVGNLLDNAIKFTPAGGDVRLVLAARQGAALVRVEDSGPGIAPDERPQVMKRFYRAERSRHLDGSGLGLSLVAAIAALHGFALTLSGTQGCVAELLCPALDPE